MDNTVRMRGYDMNTGVPFYIDVDKESHDSMVRGTIAQRKVARLKDPVAWTAGTMPRHAGHWSRTKKAWKAARRAGHKRRVRLVGDMLRGWFGAETV